MKLKMNPYVPNILSAFRICLVPVFIFTYFREDQQVKLWAVVIYGTAGITDFLDGYIARRCHLTSKLGKILDPLGDKLMMVSTLACITIDGILPVWAVATAVLKETLMGVGGLLIHRREREIPPSNFLGKASTVGFIAVCLALMLIPASRPYAEMLAGVAIALMFVAFGSYVVTYTAVMKRKN